MVRDVDAYQAAPLEDPVPAAARSSLAPHRGIGHTLRRWLLAEGGLPLFWILLTGVALYPVWHQRLLPMLDTPNHLALARGWHNYHDPAYQIAKYYALRIRPVPYLLFYASIHALMFVFPIEIANKIFLSAYLILFPISVLSLGLALRRSPWLALGAFPLAFNPNWIYGFSSYLMGTCFMFFSFAALIVFLRRGQARYAWVVLICCLLAYFAHILAWFVFGLGAIALLILHRRQLRRASVAAAAMAPSLILAIWSFVEERRQPSFLARGKEWNGVWRDFPTSVIEFPRRVLEIFPGDLDMAVLLVLAATVAGLCLWKGTHAPGADERERKQIPLLLLVFGLAYLSLPYQFLMPMAWWYVAPRMPSIMAPFLLLWPGGRLSPRQRWLLVPVLIAGLILPLKLGSLYRDFSRRNAGFMRLVKSVPLGSTVFVVVRGMMGGYNAESSGDAASSGPVYWHFSSWPMALRGGFSPYLFDQGIPLRPKHSLRAPPLKSWDTFVIREAPEFDYYLVRDPDEAMERDPALKSVERVGDWVLFRRAYDFSDEP